MKVSKWFALVCSFVLVATASAEHVSILYLASFKGTASGTNDAGVVKSFLFPGKELITICQEGVGFATAKGLTLVYDYDAEELSVANVTNRNIECEFLVFRQLGDSVVSDDGINRRRLMNIHLPDSTLIGTAVFVERFKFDSMHAQTGYSLQATFQLVLPSDDSAILGADRPTIMTGKFTASRELVAHP